jgi:hypothetical protein
MRRMHATLERIAVVLEKRAKPALSSRDGRAFLNLSRPAPD